MPNHPGTRGTALGEYRPGAKRYSCPATHALKRTSHNSTHMHVHARAARRASPAVTLARRRQPPIHREQPVVEAADREVGGRQHERDPRDPVWDLVRAVCARG